MSWIEHDNEDHPCCMYLNQKKCFRTTVRPCLVCEFSISSIQNLCKGSFCWMLASIHNNSGRLLLASFSKSYKSILNIQHLVWFFRGLWMCPFVRSLADLICPTVLGVSYWKVACPCQAKRDDVGLFVMVSNPFILSSQTAHTPTPSPPKPQNSVRFLLAKFKQISAQAGSPC